MLAGEADHAMLLRYVVNLERKVGEFGQDGRRLLEADAAAALAHQQQGNAELEPE